MEINEIFSEYAESKNIFRTGSDNVFEWYTDSPNYFRNLKCELHETERECILSVFLPVKADCNSVNLKNRINNCIVKVNLTMDSASFQFDSSKGDIFLRYIAASPKECVSADIIESAVEDALMLTDCHGGEFISVLFGSSGNLSDDEDDLEFDDESTLYSDNEIYEDDDNTVIL